MKLSDERLDELVEEEEKAEKYWADEDQTYSFMSARDRAIALRELRDYRKAVNEYLEAVDAAAAHERTDMLANEAGWFARRCTLLTSVSAAEASLRALQERT